MQCGLPLHNHYENSKECVVDSKMSGADYQFVINIKKGHVAFDWLLCILLSAAYFLEQTTNGIQSKHIEGGHTKI